MYIKNVIKSTVQIIAQRLEKRVIIIQKLTIFLLGVKIKK